ncbi:MAG TPA: MFS transporter [Flavobacteriaceae bacterium]|nr:MFS transporter [Flavobacteriaceae bacterium]HQU22285.1 MFS transporter [Flavobacteriaceae bacterium]HQU65981.1 MFS transporter [Flavobacteriaceae bacterium]HRW44928.1 MFS transporter [Flavobacteriaceae bacterium]
MKRPEIPPDVFIFSTNQPMKKYYRSYLNNFRGLSREIWLLSFVTFINRAGAMVIPFLSLYLENEQGFSLPQIGWIMTSFGAGSFVGTWIGGRLTDSIGFYKVIVLSLLTGGLGYIGLQFLDGFYALCIGVFFLILMADAYRPAIFVACDAYCKPENITRGIALLRLAINLGFSFGPLLGGIIITKISYHSLFWIDGLTCIIAAVLLFILLKPEKLPEGHTPEPVVKEGRSPYRNGLYLLFFVIMILNGMLFVQYFSLMPLFYKMEHSLPEDLIGLLLFLNGVLIVVFEMPLVGWLERIQISKTMATFWGVVFLALSFIVLNFSPWIGILVIGMFFMTLGEMIGSPFSNALALSMAPKGRKGSYMAFYTMSWSIAHVVGHNGGMNLVDRFGFQNTWYAFFGILTVVALMTLYLLKRLKQTPTPTGY